MKNATVGSIPTPKKVGVLGERNMRWYLGGQLFSLTGLMLQSAVLSLLVLKIVGKNDAAFWIGLVWSLNVIPGIFLGPFAGILLDKWDRRKTLMVTCCLGALQPLSLAYLTWTNKITIPEICILTFLLGIVNAIDAPGRNIIVKDAVLHKHDERQASKMFTSLYNLAQITGPGFAGYLVLNYGFTFTFFLNSFSFIGVLIALIMMRIVPKETRTASAQIEKKGVWKLIYEGAHYTFTHSGIFLCTLLTSVVCIFGWSYYAILAVISRDMFHGNAIVYSHLAASSGVGSMVGMLIIIKFDKKLSHKLTVIFGMIALGLSLVLFSQMHNVIAGMATLFIVGLCFMMTFSTLRSSTIYMSMSEVSGIVIGIGFTFFYGGAMLGSFGAGLFANHFGCVTMLLISGSVLVLIGLITTFLPGINELDKEH